MLFNLVYLNNSFISTFSILGQFIFLILIFTFVIFLTYFTTKFLAGWKFKSYNKGNITIIESISIGTSSLLIIKVSKQYFLISSSKDGIRFLSEIKDLDIKIYDSNLDNNKSNFLQYFYSYLGRFKDRGEK